MSKYFRVTVKATGGEYTFGAIENEEEKQAMLDAIENDEVGSSIYYIDSNQDEVSLESFEIASLVHVYGPEINGAEIIVQECKDEEFSEDIGDELIHESMDELECGVFTSSNPVVSDEFKDGCADDSLLWATEKVEKRIHFPVELILDDGDDFDISNVFVGAMNLDETINGAEIANVICYIPKDEQVKLLKAHLDGDVSGDVLSDYINDIIYEKPEALSEFVLEVGDIEGKGDWENDYNIVTTLDGAEVLYEAGEY
jgi:hypothetical protein